MVQIPQHLGHVWNQTGKKDLSCLLYSTSVALVQEQQEWRTDNSLLCPIYILWNVLDCQTKWKKLLATSVIMISCASWKKPLCLLISSGGRADISPWKNPWEMPTGLAYLWLFRARVWKNAGNVENTLILQVRNNLTKHTQATLCYTHILHACTHQVNL